jgi:hypothetical protein
MIVSQGATFAGIEPFASWNTPIAWTGFILFADGVVFRRRANSWIRSAPAEFALLAAASIPLWIVFEGYNLRIENWYYTGLTEVFWLRQFGFAWAFATIWPAVFEGADLVSVTRGTQGDGQWRQGEGQRDEGRGLGGSKDVVRAEGSGQRAERNTAAFLSMAIGLVMLASPFLVSRDVAQYLAAPVWLGFIFLLEPINRWIGAQALTRDRTINLAVSGLLCGVLWEFWNYWSRSKWHYTVPIMPNLKLFEMPLLGYFGFPPFALETFTMYVFVRSAFTKLGRTIAL